MVVCFFVSLPPPLQKSIRARGFSVWFTDAHQCLEGHLAHNSSAEQIHLECMREWII